MKPVTPLNPNPIESGFDCPAVAPPSTLNPQPSTQRFDHSLYAFLKELWANVDDSGYGCPHLRLSDFELQLTNDLLASPRPLTPSQREEVISMKARMEPHLHCNCTGLGESVPSNKMKYIIISRQGLESAILFPEHVNHSDAINLQAVAPISAGFCAVHGGPGDHLWREHQPKAQTSSGRRCRDYHKPLFHAP